MEKQLNRTGWQELTDQQLVVHARLGDRHAFGELVQRHHAAIYRVCYRILFDVEDAADATQDAFLRAYKKIDTFHNNSGFKTWMVRIAVNVSLSARSHLKSELPLDTIPLPASLSAETEVMQTEAAAELYRTLQVLPTNHRAAVILRDLEGFSYAEVAVALNVPEGTAKGWVHRGRQRLKDLLT
jgi:RNA polymerase sigma-70 factor (ECF subfamily)